MRVFLSYAPADECLREGFVKHLDVLEKQGLLRSWHAGLIGAGEHRRGRIGDELEAADLILLLVSADFLASAECCDVSDQALQRRRLGAARVVPVLLRPCLWDSTQLAGSQVLPRDGRPVTAWGNLDEAWLDVARGIRELAQRKGAVDGAVSSVPPAGDSANDTSARRTRSEKERIALLSRLEDALVRRRQISGTEASPAPLDQEILGLKRQLRGGGQVRQGDCLGGRYSLHRRIGKGGFATVWEGEDRQRRARVAIKVLHSNLAEDPDRRDRFFRGARIMEKLKHSSVVPILLPQGQDDGFHYFVMEYVLGGDLHSTIKERKLPQDRIVPLILRVGEALVAAHARGYVHRDVKPHNVLLELDGTPKLTDFDLVSVVGTTGGTRTGAMGTFLYAPPEVMTRPQDADARADVYGLGMTAAFCFFGSDLPVSLLEDKQRFLEQLGCSDSVKDVLRRAVASQVELRFSSMAAFCVALRRAAFPRVSVRPGPPAKSAAMSSTDSGRLDAAETNETPRSTRSVPPQAMNDENARSSEIPRPASLRRSEPPAQVGSPRHQQFNPKRILKPVGTAKLGEMVNAILGPGSLPTTGKDGDAARASEARRGTAALRNAAPRAGMYVPDHARILWVDDRPGNTPRLFRCIGLTLTLAFSTDEALEALTNQRFLAVISDMVRKEGAREGYALLDQMRKRGDKTPYFVYTPLASPEHQSMVKRHGGQGCTSNADELLQMVISVVQRMSK